MDEIEIAEIQKVPDRWKDKPKRRYVRKRRLAKPVAKPEKADGQSPYIGLSDRTCCTACEYGKCVITGGFFCGRPGLALQPVDMGRPDVMARRQEADKYLAHQMTERKHNALR